MKLLNANVTLKLLIDRLIHFMISSIFIFSMIACEKTECEFEMERCSPDAQFIQTCHRGAWMNKRSCHDGEMCMEMTNEANDTEGHGHGAAGSNLSLACVDRSAHSAGGHMAGGDAHSAGEHMAGEDMTGEDMTGEDMTGGDAHSGETMGGAESTAGQQG
jgi:hypothetical protein